MNNSEQLLSTAEVAEKAGTHYSTVTRWVKTGKLQAVYKADGLRGFYMFDAEHVEAFLRERAQHENN